ncbi:tetratricopeptide repeat protein [Thalassotalea profundi]|uniref:Tetratricopeptide repeat protein n=1 Tax=Thalassotalea profundi TaxID=2036687 RepID=A0ABQ3INP0_9GAMM|nr:tetratricopeptide repeat protein [Thalassotalea profundi]GHE89118.1 hypothetical protein GCM10011501_18230 [Thalassotalea profundi]
MNRLLKNKCNFIAQSILCCVITFFYSSIVHAQAENVNHSIIQVNKVCARSAVECLELVEVELKRTTPNTYIWYDLLQHKFDALFDLQKISELNKAVTPWIDQEKLPNSFKITVYIYYAKTSFIQEDIDRAYLYSQKAKNKLIEMNQVFPSPMRLIQLANLQMRLNEDDLAYETLQALEKKYEKSKNAHFMMELYGNLGHVTRNLSLHELSLEYCLKTIPWSKKYNNQQQIGTVLFNLAKAYLHFGHYNKAEKTLHEAQEFSKKAKDEVKVNQIQLYLIEIKLQQLQTQQAKILFDQINVNYLPKSDLPKITKLQKTLSGLPIAVN